MTSTPSPLGFDPTATERLHAALASIAQWLKDVDATSAQRSGWGLDLLHDDVTNGDVGSPSRRDNATRELAAQRTLRLARHDIDGPVLLIKGLAAAALWPPACRPLSDVDILVPDAEPTWQTLRAAGWTLGDLGPHHWRPGVMWDPPWHWHAHPLEPPGGGVLLEVHRRAPWPLVLHEMGAGVPTRDLLERSLPAPEDLLTADLRIPEPADHALILAAAAWGDHPYERLSRLVDVRLHEALAGPEAVAERARRYGLERLWCNVAGAAHAVFEGDRPPLSYRLLGTSARRGSQAGFVRPQRLAGMFFIAPPEKAAATLLRRVTYSVRRLQHCSARS